MKKYENRRHYILRKILFNMFLLVLTCSMLLSGIPTNAWSNSNAAGLMEPLKPMPERMPIGPTAVPLGSLTVTECVFPELCTEEDCKCNEAGNEVECKCEADCPCIMYVPVSIPNCVLPELCENEDCMCGDPENTDGCECDGTCPCIKQVSACLNPGNCTSKICRCGTSGNEDLCFCGYACLCRFPDFTVDAKTGVSVKRGATTIKDESGNIDLKTGEVANIQVNVSMSSSEANFSDVLIKTYIKGPLESLNTSDIYGRYEVEDIDYNVEINGEIYTVVTVKSTISGSAAGQYGFDVRFPPGIIEDGTTADIYTVIEGVVTIPGSGMKGMHFTEEQDTKGNTVVCTAEAETEWKLKVENVDLDYKDPENDDSIKKIFRQKITLSRDTGGDIGVYYLKEEGTKLVITLPGKCEEGDPVTNIVRLTNGSETVILPSNYSVVYNDFMKQYQVIIDADKIPYDSGFSKVGTGTSTDIYSSANSATLFLVFEIDTDKLDPNIAIGGFTIYEDLEMNVDYYYTLADNSTTKLNESANVALIDYTPGKGGGGSIAKDAHRQFVEGKTFFSKNTEAPDIMTPVWYTVAYHNNSNTPITKLVLTDNLPDMLTLEKTLDGKSTHTVTATGVPTDAISFYQVKLSSITSTYITDADGNSIVFKCWVVPYAGATRGNPIELPLNMSSVSIPETIYDEDAEEWKHVDKICIEITDEYGGYNYELKHGFYIRAELSVTGDPAMALSENETVRKKINFLLNTIKFSAVSTKPVIKIVDGEQVYTYPTLGSVNGDSALVHIYPFDNDLDPAKVWNLSGSASGSAGGSYSASGSQIQQGKDVYYRINVTPLDATQHVYSSVFYLELPPDIVFTAADFAGITMSGAAGGIDFQYELIDNPVGPGQMLKIYDPNQRLLDPTTAGAIIVRAQISPDASRGSTITSRVYFGIQDVKTPLDEQYYIDNSKKYITETAGFAGKGEAPPLLLESSVSVTVRGSGLLEGELWVQTEFDRGTDTWHRHPEISKALPGGLLTYKFVVRNGGDLYAENLVLYNVFSHQLDNYIISGTGRKSEWMPYLVGPVDLSALIEPDATPESPYYKKSWSDVATVYYSEYSDHQVKLDGTYKGTDDWTTTPYNWASVKAIKIVFDADYSLPPKTEISLQVPMYAPVEYKVVDSNNNSKDIAISSLATQFNFENGPVSAIEPLKITVKLIENAKGEISGVVWGDINDDGNNDVAAGTEFYEPNVTIELWKAGKKLQDTTTDLDGKYKFTNLPLDIEYELRVILPAGYDYLKTPVYRTGLNPGDDNDFITYGEYYDDEKDVTNRYVSYVVTISETNRIVLNTDSGIVPAPASISGNVWRDLNGDAERDTTLSGGEMADAGIADITVTLYRMPGGGAAPVKMSETTTEANGDYTFADLPAGRYFVVFGGDITGVSLPDNYSYSTPRMKAPESLWSTGNPGYSQALPKVEPSTALKLGQSYEIWLESAQEEEGVDCGLTPVLGSISGMVWRDTNGDGINNDGKTGIAGITVILEKTSDYIDLPYDELLTKYVLTFDTKSDGKYEFKNLTPGEYKVTFIDSTGKEYVSYNAYPDTAISELLRDKVDDFAGFAGIEISPEEDKLSQADYDIGLVQKFDVSGKVFNDKNNDATFNNTDTSLTATGITINRTGGGDGTTFTDNTIFTTSGNYLIEGLWPGSYEINFTGTVQGYDDGEANNTFIKTAYEDYLVTTKEANGFSRATRTWTLANVTSGSNQTEKNLSLTRPRSIQGMVWHDRDGDKTLNGTEEYLVRSLTINTTPTVTKPSTADSNGYCFTGLYPGTYTVTVTPTGNFMLTNSGTNLTTAGVYTVTIPALDEGSNKDPKDKDFGLAQPVTLSGTIWQDKEMNSAVNYVLNGVNDSGTDALLALTGIATLYRYEGGNWVNKITAASVAGAYSFTNQLPGTYKVVFSPDEAKYFITGPAVKTSGYIQTTGLSTSETKTANYDPALATWDNIVLYSNDTVTNLNLSLGEYATISGTFWHDINGDGLVNGVDERLDNTVAKYGTKTVTLMRYNDVTGKYDVVIATANNNTTGAYAFSKVKPGKYILVFNQNAWRVTNEDDDLDVDNTNLTVADRYAEWSVDYIIANKLSYPDNDYLVSMFSEITGTVWIDKDADAVIDLDELPKVGSTLTLNYVSGPYITSWWPSYPHPKTITVNSSNGNYKFDELWPGTYEVTLNTANLSDYFRTNITTDTNLWTWTIVIVSADQKDVNFGLVKPSSLSGDIWHDEDNSKTKNSGETGIGNVTLTRTNVLTGMRPFTKTIAVTPATGFAFIKELLPGTYTLTSDLSADWLLTYFAASDLTFSGGTGSNATIAATTNNKVYNLTITDGTGDGVVVTDAIAGYALQSTIKGTVYSDKNYNQNKEAEETVITGVTTTLKRLTDSGEGYDASFTTRKSDSGEFTFTGLLPGKYEITFTVPTGWMTTTQNKTVNGTPSTPGQSVANFTKSTRTWIITIPDDNEVITLDTGLVYKSSISGYVWKDYDNSKAKNGTEPFYPGLIVNLYQNWNSATKTGDLIATVSATGTNGDYLFDDLYPGDYTVVLTMPDNTWYVTLPDNQTNLMQNKPEIPVTLAATLTAGQTSTGHNFGLTQLVKIDGLVFEDFDANGTQDVGDIVVTGITAYLSGSVSGFTTLTSSNDGTFNFKNLAAGVYTLTFDGIQPGWLVTTPNGAEITAGSAKAVFNSATRTWTITVVTDTPSMTIKTGIVPKSSISGYVWKDYDNSRGINGTEPYFPGQTVTLYKNWNSATQTGTLVDTVLATGANGEYLFDNLYPGIYTVVLTKPTDTKPWFVTLPNAEADLKANKPEIPVELTANEAEINHNFGLIQLVAITEYVFEDINANGVQDPGEEIVTGITGYFNGTIGYTDGNGVYAFTDLAPGSYTLTFGNVTSDWLITTAHNTTISEKSITAVFNRNTLSWAITVISDTAGLEIKTGLVRKSSISGYVWKDYDGSKDKDSSEPYFGGQTVTLYKNWVSDTSPGTYIAATATDLNGSYLFDNLYPGNYTVVLTKPTAARPWYVTNTGSNLMTNQPIKSVDLPYNTASTGHIFGLTQLVDVTGLIFEDANVNHKQDATENIVAGVTAYLDLASGGSTGEFDFTNLAPGTYTLKFNDIPKGWQIATNNGATVNAAVGTSTAVFNRVTSEWTITVRSDSPSIKIDTGLVRKSGISGYVWKDYDGNKDINGTEQYYDGLTVGLYQWNSITETDELIKTTITDINGDYAFTDLYLGDYTVVLTVPAGWYVTNTGSNRLTNKPELNVTIEDVKGNHDNNFGLTQLISISGRVWEDNDANGVFGAADTTVENMIVNITGPYGFTRSTKTNSYGFYEFINLLCGEYTVTFDSGNGYETSDGWTITNTFAGYSSATLEVSFDRSAKSWSVDSIIGHDQNNCNFAFAALPVISGKVWEDMDGDGGYQDGENLLENIIIEIYRSTLEDGNYDELVSPADLSLKTNASGEYSFTVGQAGMYKIVVTVPGSPAGAWGMTQNKVDYITIDDVILNEVYPNKDFGLIRYITLSGLVWSELDGNGEYALGGLGENPLDGHELQITRNGVPVVAADYAAITDGTFNLTVADKLLPGTYAVIYSDLSNHIVTNSGADFDPATRTWSLGELQSGDSVNDLNCAFTPEREITGKVWYDDDLIDGIYDPANENGMKGIKVKLQVKKGDVYEDVSMYPVATQTDLNGEFSFKGLPPGSYRVIIDSDEYIRTNPGAGQNEEDKYLDYLFDERDIILTQHKQMGLILPAELSGFTFLDKNSSGAYNALTDAPCGVLVTVERISPSPYVYASFMSDSLTGLYDSFSALGERLLPGEYKITFAEIKDHSVSTTGTDFDPAKLEWIITLAPGETRAGLDIGYKKPYIITGFVWKDTNCNGKIDAGELPFKTADSVEITVSMNTPGFVPYVIYLDNDGCFSVEVDKPGDYIISADLPNGYLITTTGNPYNKSQDAFLVTLTYEQNEKHVDIGAMMFVSVSGMLWMDDNADGIKQSGEKLITNAFIQLIGANGEVIAETKTDVNGCYEFPLIPSGSYTVQLADPPSDKSFYTGFNGSDAPDKTTSSFNKTNGAWTLIVGDTDIINANSGYCALSTISGTVVDKNQNDKPLPDQTVDLYKKNPTSGEYELMLTEKTDEDGSYSFDDLLPGDYKLIITIPEGTEKTDDSDGYQDNNNNTVVIDVEIAQGKDYIEKTVVHALGDKGDETDPIKPDPDPDPDPDPKPDPDPDPDPPIVKPPVVNPPDTKDPDPKKPDPKDPNPKNPDPKDPDPKVPDSKDPDDTKDNDPDPKNPDPKDPDDPDNLNDPKGPDGTGDQSNPDDQYNRDGDVGPVGPDAPVNPQNPTNPANPQNPDDTAKTDDPGKSEDSNNPNNSNRPTRPVISVDPDDYVDIPDGSFIGKDGLILSDPLLRLQYLQPVENTSDMFLEFDENGNPLAYWQKIMVDGKEIYVWYADYTPELDIASDMTKPAETTKPSPVTGDGFNIISLVLLALSLFMCRLIIKRSRAKKDI